jgi:hypothetical protein
LGLNQPICDGHLVPRLGGRGLPASPEGMRGNGLDPSGRELGLKAAAAVRPRTYGFSVSRGVRRHRDQ